MKNLMAFCVTLLICFACSKSAEDEQKKEQEQQSQDTEMEQMSATQDEEIVENFIVMATSGLKLRAKPNGEKLATIPYRGEVERLGSQAFGALEVEEIKGFKVKGEWVKVRYKGKEGYVFSGFLTKHKMPKLVKEYDYEKYSSAVDYHFSTMFKKDGNKYAVEKLSKEECGSDNPIYCYRTYSQDYDKGNVKYKNSMADSGSEQHLKLKNMSLEEAYFMVKAMNFNGVTGTKDANLESIIYNKTKNEISIEADGAGCYSTIKENGKDAEVEVYCGC